MPKPLPPAPKAVEFPQALQIAQLQQDIKALQASNHHRSAMEEAQIVEQISQRTEAQRYLFAQIPGVHTSDLSADKVKVEAKAILNKRKTALQEKVRELEKEKGSGVDYNLAATIADLKSQVDNLTTLANDL